MWQRLWNKDLNQLVINMELIDWTDCQEPLTQGRCTTEFFGKNRCVIDNKYVLYFKGNKRRIKAAHVIDKEPLTLP